MLNSKYNESKDSEKIFEILGPLNKKFTNSRILITGSAGFLGYNFLHYFDRLTKEKWANSIEIIATDNFIRGRPKWLNKLEANNPQINVLKHDIVKDPLNFTSDYIIHAASIASPIVYRKYPIETIQANVIGTQRLLDLAKNNTVKSFLFFSSSEIYGDPDPKFIPTLETYNGNVSCVGPRACYDESKRLGETLCYNYHDKYNVKVKIVRPFNNYGPGLKINDRRVISDFFRSIINSNKIVLLSDGSATRTFCYVSDAIEGYLRALLSEENGEAFNIGNSSPEISILELANLIGKVCDSNPIIEYQKSVDKNYLKDNPNRRCPNTSKALNLLSFKAKTDLEEGLRNTWEFYSNNEFQEETGSKQPL